MNILFRDSSDPVAVTGWWVSQQFVVDQVASFLCLVLFNDSSSLT